MIIDDSPIATPAAVAYPGVRNAVCLCTDRNMLIPALFVAHSVRTMAAASAIPFDVVIVAEAKEVTDTHRAWMAEHGILLHDRIDLSGLHGVATLPDRLSVATLTKLLLPEIFAGHYDRILYLDADLTIHDDAAAIFALDIGEFALAASSSGRPWGFHTASDRARAEEHFAALGMTRPYSFFNSGVLYINVASWNRNDLGARTLSFIGRNADICFLPDEHGLNGVLNGAFAPLSPIWNMRPRSMQTVARDIARPVIVHHAGEDKPWRRFGYHKRLFPDRTAYRAYEAFLKDTPWPRWLDGQWSGRDLRANVAWEVRRITRALRGQPSPDPSRRQHEEYLSAFRRYCAEERFTDVEQGIVVREDGVLSLRHAREVTE